MAERNVICCARSSRECWLRSNRAQLSQETRQVYYLSMEFLIGRTLSNAMLSLGIYEDVQGALEAMGLDSLRAD
ncbi:hypothetical protein ACLBOM_04730 [Escherichia coli]